MDGTFNYSEINNSICEAIGCFAKATNKIAVKVGTLGVISLLVCSDCIVKFQEDSVHETVGPKAPQEKEVESSV